MKNKTLLKKAHRILFLVFFLPTISLKYNTIIAKETKEEKKTGENNFYKNWRDVFGKKLIQEYDRERKILSEAHISQSLLNLISNEYICSINNLTLLLRSLCLNNEWFVKPKPEYEHLSPTSKNFERSIGVQVEKVKNKIVFIGPLRGPIFISTVLEWCIKHEKEIDYIVFLGDFCDHKEYNDILYVLILMFIFLKICTDKIILIHGNEDYSPYPNGEYTEEEALAKKLMDIKVTQINEEDGDIYEIQEGNMRTLVTFYLTIPYNAIFTFENGKRVYCAQNTLPFVIKKNEKGEDIIDNTEYVSGLPSILHKEDDKETEEHNRAFSNRLSVNDKDTKITKEEKHFLIPKSIFEDFMIEKGIDSCVFCGNENKTMPFDDNTKSINMVHSKKSYNKTSDKDNKGNTDSEESKDNEGVEEDKKPSILIVEGDKEYHITIEDMLKEKEEKEKTK